MTMTIESWLLVMFVIVAFWQKDSVFNILAGAVVFFTGLSWLGDYLVLSMCLMALGGYFWALTIMSLLKRE